MWKGSHDVDSKEVKRWDEGIERAIKKKKKEIGRKSKGLDIFSALNFCQFFFNMHQDASVNIAQSLPSKY